MRQRVQARRRGAERGERGGKGEEGVIKGLHQLRVGGIHAIDVSLHLGTRGFLLGLKPGGSSSHEDERVLEGGGGLCFFIEVGGTMGWPDGCCWWS